jgi:PPOX class probable F420-dependent enzyme
MPAGAVLPGTPPAPGSGEIIAGFADNRCVACCRQQRSVSQRGDGSPSASLVSPTGKVHSSARQCARLPVPIIRWHRREEGTVAISIPPAVRQLLDAPNYVHLSTLRADGSPRNWVVWVGLEGEYILVCTSYSIWKAKDMRRDPRVAMSVTDMADPYRMAAVQGRVVEIRSDEGCRYMDPISFKYTNTPFPSRGRDRVCFVIAVEKAASRTLDFVHNSG